MHSNNSKVYIIALAALVAGLIIGYLLSGREQVVVADSSAEISALSEQLAAMQAQLDRIEDCACDECPPCEVVDCDLYRVFTATVPVTTFVPIVLPGNSPIVTVTEPVSEPVSISTPAPSEASDEYIINLPDEGDEEEEFPTVIITEPTATPVPTTEPAEEEEEVVEEEDKGKEKSKCNQGLGNGSEGCDPGNSNNNHVSNDEGTNADGSNKTPGNGGRKNSEPLNKEEPKGNKGGNGKKNGS